MADTADTIDRSAGRRRDYLRDPAEIIRASRAIALAETDLGGVPDDLVEVALRLVYASAMPEIVADLAFSPGAGAAGRAALGAGATVLVDGEMTAHGIDRARLPAANPIRCTLSEPGVADRAQRLGAAI